MVVIGIVEVLGMPDELPEFLPAFGVAAPERHRDIAFTTLEYRRERAEPAFTAARRCDAGRRIIADRLVTHGRERIVHRDVDELTHAGFVALLNGQDDAEGRPESRDRVTYGGPHESRRAVRFAAHFR